MATRTAQFTTIAQKNIYTLPVGTTPTEWRARAVQGASTKAGKLAYGSPAEGSTIAVPVTFDDTTEAGNWQGWLELWDGPNGRKIDEKGPLPFTVPAGPVTLTFVGPGAFTISIQ